MPTYLYRCPNNHKYEENRKITEPEKIKDCVICGEKVKQVYSPPGVQFKGSGFYRNSK